MIMLPANSTPQTPTQTLKSTPSPDLNEREAAQLAFGSEKGALDTQAAWQEACESFMEQGVKHVVITLGDKGACWASEGKSNVVPAVENVKIEDTTGAE